jgi:hypothetical protein
MLMDMITGIISIIIIGPAVVPPINVLVTGYSHSKGFIVYDNTRLPGRTETALSHRKGKL